MKESKKDEDLRIYAYKLYADVKQNSMKVEDIPMSKDKWYESGERLAVLDSWVRNESNPGGILRLKIYSPAEPKVDILANKKLYTAEELLAMTRPNLVKLCESWEINSMRKKKAKLVELLMKKMTLLKQSQEENKIEEPEEPKEDEEPEDEAESTTLTEDELNNIIDDKNDDEDDTEEEFRIGL